MHICKKNKFIHKDIKAVCSSATKKLVAMGLVAATTVAGVSYKNIASAQPPGGYSAEQIEKLVASIVARGTKQVAATYSYYEYDSNKAPGNKALNSNEVDRYWKLPEDKQIAAHDAFTLRHRLDYLRERIRDYNKRLEKGFLSLVTHSQRYKEVEASLQPRPQSPEPDRYNIDQAPAYVEWATKEVKRLEPLARVMLQQLRVGAQEQTDFENRMRWLTPGEHSFLEYMSEENSLEGFFTYAQKIDDVRREVEKQKKQVKELQIDMDELTEQIRRNMEELTDIQQNLQHIREENLAFFSQRYESPFNNNPVQNDNNMIHNNQIQEIVEIREVVEEPEDLNMINNNQVEEHNPENNNQQQQQPINIDPLNPPVRQIIHETLNQPTPQQGNGIVRGTINFVGNVLSFFNPFN